MSIKDAVLSMCDGTALGTSIASAALKGDYIDLGAQRDFYDGAKTPDIGEGGNLWWNCYLTTSVASSASPVITIALYHHTTASVASGAALITGASVLEVAAGKMIARTKLPAGTINRYLGTVVTIASAAITAGAIDSWISMDSETPK